MIYQHTTVVMKRYTSIVAGDIRHAEQQNVAEIMEAETLKNVGSVVHVLRFALFLLCRVFVLAHY
jgi:hypothetical protein